MQATRTLFGTEVEIVAESPSQWNSNSELNEAIEAAFQLMQEIHNITDGSNSQSELYQLHISAQIEARRVSKHLWRILDEALKFCHESLGAFDIVRVSSCGACYKDVELLPNQEVRFKKQLSLNIENVARGYAIDCAIGLLKNNGIEAGSIKAAGDLAVFGPNPKNVYLRDPAAPNSLNRINVVANQACSTSAACYSKSCGTAVSGLMDAPIGVSVTAKKCLDSGALSKIVECKKETAVRLLRKFNAAAFLFERDYTPS